MVQDTNNNNGDHLNGHRLKIAANVIVSVAFAWSHGAVTNSDAAIIAFFGWVYAFAHTMSAINNIGRDH